MTNYNITIGYKAALTFDIKAENKEEAEKKALDFFIKQRGFKSQKIRIEDDAFKVDGVLDMDNTWNKM